MSAAAADAVASSTFSSSSASAGALFLFVHVCLSAWASVHVENGKIFSNKEIVLSHAVPTTKSAGKQNKLS